MRDENVALRTHATCADAVLVSFLLSQSLAAEIELFVGPYYTVKTNQVDTVIEVHSTPKREVHDTFVEKFKQWLIKIGV